MQLSKNILRSKCVQSVLGNNLCGTSLNHSPKQFYSNAFLKGLSSRRSGLKSSVSSMHSNFKQFNNMMQVSSKEVLLQESNFEKMFFSSSIMQGAKIQVSDQELAEQNTRRRNVAIIAHVDHGKTTLVDCLLKQTKTVSDETEDRVMDSMALERERGITIMSKITNVKWQEYDLNIVDTPGHADFGGEVERIMSTVDGVVLLVDATEGPMTQTRFVLKKALEEGLKPIVVFNKVDRPTSRIGEVENEVFDLFVNLDASDEQIEFPILYASAKEGWLVEDLDEDPRENMEALFKTIVKYVHYPKIKPEEPFKMSVTSIDYDKVFGKILTGKIHSGFVQNGDKVKSLNLEGNVIEEGKVFQLMKQSGMARVKTDVGYAGEIVSITGLEKSSVTNTIGAPENEIVIPSKPLDPPILSVTLSANDSPLAGTEGDKVSSVLIRQRLHKEIETNIALKIEEEGDRFKIMGRGEMQIAILVEQMRREGYEFLVSPPEVVFKKDENDKLLEPIEEVVIDAPSSFGGTIMEMLNERKGEMSDYKRNGEFSRLIYFVPTRFMLGFDSKLKQLTSGQSTVGHMFHEYRRHCGPSPQLRKGAMISMSQGRATAYALGPMEARGTLMIKPGDPVYEGMIVGEHTRAADIEVNPTKAKQLTNMRASGKDETIRLSPVMEIPLEEYLCYVNEDEMIEVTPVHIRLRKRLLTSLERKKAKRSSPGGV